MNFNDALVTLRNLDASIEQQAVPPTVIQPLGGNLVSIDGQDFTWTDEAAHQVRPKYGVTEALEKPLPTGILQMLWRALVQDEAKRPISERRFPSLMKTTFHQGQVVGFSDGNLATLSNSQVAEAIKAATKNLPLEEARVVLTGNVKAAAWQLKLIFPFEKVEPREGDVVCGGLTIRHSAAGLYGTQVQNYLHRMWCKNGATVPICQGQRRLRIRRRRDSQFADQEVIDKLRLVIEQGVRELKGKLEAVKALAAEKANAKELIEQIALKNRLRKTVKQRLLEALREDEGGPVQEDNGTLYDVWNAVTRVSTHTPDSLLRDGVRERLSLYSGVFSQQAVHTCPRCKRILEPSQN